MKPLLFAILLLANDIIQAQSVGINADSTQPNASAMLDVKSTNKGLLPPRMTAAQRDAITSPAAGLMIYCTNCGVNGEWQGFNGTAWTNIIGGSISPPEVSICTQRWMTKNLDVDKYRNGDPIPHVTDLTAWAALTTGAYCYYNNDSATYAATYGKLYNWYAVNDPKGLAPAGWHVPSDAEWTTLENCLGGRSVAGGAMKETGTTHWNSPNTGATNSSGFTGLPGGLRDITGSFGSVGFYGYCWSSTEYYYPPHVWSRTLIYNYGSNYRDFSDKLFGFSVRCIKD